MYYHSFLSTLVLILLTAPLSQCIQFSHITPSAENNNSSAPSSSSLMLNWTREPYDPPFWAVNAIFTVNGKLSASNGLGFEFIVVPHSPENSGTIQIPVQATVNITLLTFTFTLPQHSKFSGKIFGQPFTFNVVTEGSSMPNISTGILPPLVQNMLTPTPTTTHKVATIIGAVIGLMVFLCIILALFILRRRRHRRRARIDAETFLRMHNALYRPTSLPPTLITFDEECHHVEESVGHSSTAWSEGGSEKEPLYGYPNDYLGHATTHISPSLFRKPDTVSTPTPRARSLNNSISSRTEKLGNDSTSESVPSIALPIPQNSLAPNRTLLYLQSPHSPSPSYLFLPQSDQGYSIEQSLAQLRGRMKLLLKQLDSESLESGRDSTERIGDEAEMIQIKLEMGRLQRILDSR